MADRYPLEEGSPRGTQTRMARVCPSMVAWRYAKDTAHNSERG